MTKKNYLWKPFTPNREFNKNPRIFTKSDGMYYTTDKNEEILDAVSGLWCCNLGNNYKSIVDAMVEQTKTMYYSPAFQIAHESEYELASLLVDIAPNNINHAFFTNSGSESIESALKLALAYQKSIGQGSRTLIIGREHAYHGVNFGGISVGGLINNKRAFNNLIKTFHMPTILDIKNNAFTKGQPKEGAIKAEALVALINTHGAENIAAVIVEPVAGSAGAHIPPVGYLERISKICKENGILLIFDEVITGFGRLGTPFAAQRFNVEPDLITTAKGLTNGASPMGALLISSEIYDAVVNNSKTPIEFFHGYTYSGHPVSCAAAIATLKAYKDEKFFQKVADIELFWEEELHSLKGLPNIIDIRNLGLVGAVQLKDTGGVLGNTVYLECFKNNVLIRVTGDTIALSPAYITTKDNIRTIVKTIGDAIKKAS
jgi:beta-alanine--pyruvate transaminase